MKPFSHGEYGSKIIVTTQSEKVASMVHDLPPYHLTTLSSDACWNLFKKVAFNNSNPIVPSELEEIGREIVEKCNGQPLAVKSLCSLLRHQSNSKDWESIRDSDIWELSQKNCNILHALWLSYQYLPSHLKQCFAYCSIFPKGFQFAKEDLIKLWMAEDLLHPQKSKRTEEVGEEFVHDLLSRSLFKKSIKLDKSVCLTMHDLVNDLATFIVGDLCLRSYCSSLNKASNNKIRYWSHLKGENDNCEKFEGLVEAKHLRTLLLTSTRHFTAKLELANLLPLLTCLRVLSLYNTSITELPDSIVDLKLLRYLNLSGTRIKKILNGVCTLYNLQTLLLRNCSELFLLPPETVNLTNLRHLDIECTSIKEMPKEMGTLKDLQTLSTFVLGKDNTVEELKNLQDLGGSLHILQLENVVKVEEVTAARLKDMKYLTELEFEWSLKSDGGSRNQNPQEVLAGLQPHTNIKVVKIKTWREFLKIGDELYGGSAEDTPFRCLELLQISQMPKCKEWSLSGGHFKGSFPKLKEIVLKASPDLTAESAYLRLWKPLKLVDATK
ncbi:putative disease resistance RPP13-like protein 1 isoform X2 [Ziziphus jujuba]|uniref:Disease resistance RPP13-like protein 1 isoform X2 n=1 Tax=Ziziphus jujuba TaxID=326968 RepID=A0ABM3IKS4_ZIZJJ|nr:putative disease resistance RPP13-like protein 1 isoform X2 [Ziziphus jujuba]